MASVGVLMLCSGWWNPDLSWWVVIKSAEALIELFVGLEMGVTAWLIASALEWVGNRWKPREPE